GTGVGHDGPCTSVRRINSFKGEASFGSWFYRIAANAAYMKLRARRGKGREIALDDVRPALDSGGVHFDPMDDWSLRVDDRALQGELRTVLDSAIAELRADYRTALILHDVEGMSTPDIADTLTCSLPAA